MSGILKGLNAAIPGGGIGKITDTFVDSEPSAFASIAAEIPPAKRQIGLMLDIESLDTGPRSVILQIALTPFDIDEEEVMDFPFNAFLPMQPQLDFITPRTISADTLLWWMDQSDEARANLKACGVDDMHSLRVIMGSFVHEFNRMISIPNSEYILVARGPQFDVVNVESLLRDLGMKAPWGYNKVVDLRTMMRNANISSKDVPQDPKMVAHDARWDNLYQIDSFFAAKKNMHRGD